MPGTAHHQVHTASNGTTKITQTSLKVQGVKHNDWVLLLRHVEVAEVCFLYSISQALQGRVLFLSVHIDVFHAHHNDSLDTIGSDIALDKSDPVQKVLKLDLGVVVHGTATERDNVDATLPQEQVNAPSIHVTREHVHYVLLVRVRRANGSATWRRESAPHTCRAAGTGVEEERRDKCTLHVLV